MIANCIHITSFKVGMSIVVGIALAIYPPFASLSNCQQNLNVTEINLLTSPIGNELRILDIIGDDYNLPKGSSNVAKPTAIYDRDWKHKTLF